MTTILLIEDNQEISHLIISIFKEARGRPFTIITAVTLDEGLEILRKNLIGGVILDLGLPDSSGIDTYRTLQKAVPHLPVVIFSGLDDERTIQSAIEEGAQEYLIKEDLNPSYLLTVVRHALKRHELLYSLKREVDERKTAELEIKKRDAQLQAIIDSFDGFIFTSSPEGIIQFMNKSLIKELGTDWTGKSTRFALRKFQRINTWFHSGNIKESQIISDEIRESNGRWYAVSSIPVIIGEGNIERLAMIWDITSKKNADIREREYARGLAELIDQGANLADLDEERSIYHAIATGFAQFAPEKSIIILSSFNQERKKLVVRTITSEAKDERILASVFGRSPEGMTFHLPPECHLKILSEESIELTDAENIRIGSLPCTILSQLREGITIKENYHVGLSWQGSLYGVATILPETGIVLDDTRLLNAFAKVASCALRRKHAEDLLIMERMLFIGGPTVVFSWDVTDGFPVRYVSPNIRELLGYEPDAFTSGIINFDSLIHEEDLTEILQERELLLKGERSRSEYEYRIIDSDGRWIWVHAFILAISNEEEKKSYLHGYLTDITGRKKAEEAKRASEADLHALMDATLDNVLLIKPDGVILAANNSFSSRFEREPKDIIGKNAYNLLPDTLAESRKIIIQKVIDSKKPVTFTDERDGLYMENHIWPIIGDDETVSRLAVYSSDITTRIQAEQFIRQSEERYRELVENARNIIIRTDNTGKIIFFNEYAGIFLGYNWEEVCGISLLGTIIPISNNEGRNIEKEIHLLHTHPGETMSLESATLRHDGTPVWISWKIRTVATGESERPGLIAIGMDITDRKNAEEALIQVNQKLHLLSSITRHDILNLITALSGYLEISLDENPSGKVREYIEKERTLVEKIQEHAEFTRDYQDMGFNLPEWQNISQICRISVRPPAGICLSCGESNLEVYADPLLGRVFYNLFDNALRHGGTITRFSITHEEQDDSCILIVEDDGNGIPDDQKENIFKKGIGKNTGLGLFLVREILSITGLAIKETGIEGKGCRFEIIIPPGKYRFLNGDI